MVPVDVVRHLLNFLGVQSKTEGTLPNGLLQLIRRNVPVVVQIKL